LKISGAERTLLEDRTALKYAQQQKRGKRITQPATSQGGKKELKPFLSPRSEQMLYAGTDSGVSPRRETA